MSLFLPGAAAVDDAGAAGGARATAVGVGEAAIGLAVGSGVRRILVLLRGLLLTPPGVVTMGLGLLLSRWLLGFAGLRLLMFALLQLWWLYFCIFNIGGLLALWQQLNPGWSRPSLSSLPWWIWIGVYVLVQVLSLLTSWVSGRSLGLLVLVMLGLLAVLWLLRLVVSRRL